MQQQYLFEYAIVRIVPQVEREEFLNTGVVLFCAKQKFLQLKFHLDKERLKIFSCDLDVEELRGYLEGFERICSGDANAGTIGKLPMAERFRWLTATRSTVLQTSKVHPGFCDDAGEMLERIFKQFVL
ncbi:MAG: DUF3037 domain-containing protein [Ferruginibacter sp.]